jgi:hypothetical protein
MPKVYQQSTIQGGRMRLAQGLSSDPTRPMVSADYKIKIGYN